MTMPLADLPFTLRKGRLRVFSEVFKGNAFIIESLVPGDDEIG